MEKGPLAQWSEQGTHNPLVVGSIPTRPTKGGNYGKTTIRMDLADFAFPASLQSLADLLGGRMGSRLNVRCMRKND